MRAIPVRSAKARSGRFAMKIHIEDRHEKTMVNAAPIAIVEQGPSWLVVEKPCGMSVHNDPGSDLCSMIAGAMKAGRVGSTALKNPRIHPVHRLDRDTSGLVILATDAATCAFLSAQFVDRQVGKTYLVLVHGAPSDASAGEWTWPLTDRAGGRKDPAGRGKRLACTTRWRMVAQSGHYALLECDLLSGRKHQIRRHARLSGHAVVGDRRYGSTRSVRFLADRCGFNRLGLHAHALSIRLPGSPHKTTFSSGGLPQAMQALLESDRLAAPDKGSSA